MCNLLIFFPRDYSNNNSPYRWNHFCFLMLKLFYVICWTLHLKSYVLKCTSKISVFGIKLFYNIFFPFQIEFCDFLFISTTYSKNVPLCVLNASLFSSSSCNKSQNKISIDFSFCKISLCQNFHSHIIILNLNNSGTVRIEL